MWLGFVLWYVMKLTQEWLVKSQLYSVQWYKLLPMRFDPNDSTEKVFASVQGTDYVLTIEIWLKIDDRWAVRLSSVFFFLFSLWFSYEILQMDK